MQKIQIVSPSRHQYAPLFHSQNGFRFQGFYCLFKERVQRQLCCSFEGYCCGIYWNGRECLGDNDFGQNITKSTTWKNTISRTKEEEEEWRKTERIPTQHCYQAHFIKVASPFPRLCCNIAHQHDTKRGAHVCGERLSLHRRLIVSPYTHAFKFICVVIWLRRSPGPQRMLWHLWIVVKKKDNER